MRSRLYRPGLRRVRPPRRQGAARAQAAGGVAGTGPGFHLAFDAADPAAVDRFHTAALRHGGTDDGAPGPRPEYSPTYYAAFVLDPDGNKLEAVHQ